MKLSVLFVVSHLFPFSFGGSDDIHFWASSRIGWQIANRAWDVINAWPGRSRKLSLLPLRGRSKAVVRSRLLLLPVWLICAWPWRQHLLRIGMSWHHRESWQLFLGHSEVWLIGTRPWFALVVPLVLANWGLVVKLETHIEFGPFDSFLGQGVVVWTRVWVAAKLSSLGCSERVCRILGLNCLWLRIIGVGWWVVASSQGYLFLFVTDGASNDPTRWLLDSHFIVWGVSAWPWRRNCISHGSTKTTGQCLALRFWSCQTFNLVCSWAWSSNSWLRSLWPFRSSKTKGWRFFQCS